MIMQVLQIRLGFLIKSCSQNEAVASGLSIKVWCYNGGIDCVLETPQGFSINVCRTMRVLHYFKPFAIFDWNLQMTWTVL
jgi:hypothetical protein